MPGRTKPGALARLPLFLLIWGVASLSMWVPASHALIRDQHAVSRSFFYSGLLGVVCVVLIALARSGRPARHGALGQLLALLATFAVLPVFLAVPLHDAVQNTRFLNAYFDMVSAITTTGAVAEYGTIEETISPEALAIIETWIGERFGHGQGSVTKTK